MVVLKISIIQLHVLSQTSGLNFSPLDITKFSKQFVPDRANCSLSAKKPNIYHQTSTAIYSNQSLMFRVVRWRLQHWRVYRLLINATDSIKMFIVQVGYKEEKLFIIALLLGIRRSTFCYLINWLLV